MKLERGGESVSQCEMDRYGSAVNLEVRGSVQGIGAFILRSD